MSWVVIVKTAKDEPLWGGLPEDYPIKCLEVQDREQAACEHPGKVILTLESYNLLKKSLDEAHACPKWWKERGASEQAQAIKPENVKRWQFWKYI